MGYFFLTCKEYFIFRKISDKERRCNMVIPNKEFDLRYLRALSRRFPTISKASTEVINLSAILNLPKGTEHFVSDLHGEYEQFLHVLKNASGSIKQKIEEEYGDTLSISDKKTLATLIYYPEEKLHLMEKEMTDERELNDWYKITINRLIRIIKRAASKSTRSRVRKALDPSFTYIFEELVFANDNYGDKEDFCSTVVSTIISIEQAHPFIVAICNTIQRLAVSRLHVLGDIYDRGPGPHIIMDTLMDGRNVDIQWGNHDITWMAAASGHPACIAIVLRIAAKYGELDTIEDGYGINLVPLVRFVTTTYQQKPGVTFNISFNKETYNLVDLDSDRRVHKALAILQFKLEGQVIRNHPEFQMDDRLLLDCIDYDRGIVIIDGKEYELTENDFPTIDPADPYKLTEEEQNVIDQLVGAFRHSEKLNRHVRFLYDKGGLYKTHNNNLLYHGCIPLNEDGTFTEVTIGSKTFSGKALYDELDRLCRQAYYRSNKTEKRFAQDIMWFIWNNKNSPLFGKNRMTTFERYFIADKSTWIEHKNPYYSYVDDETVVNSILSEFGLDAGSAHLINGHVPVKVDEDPIKCGGKLLCIDGGFSKAYRSTTGIGGYTLIYNSHRLELVAHLPFKSADYAIRTGSDIHSDKKVVETFPLRRLVRDMDNGRNIQQDIDDLMDLLMAYRLGLIPEASN